LRYPVPPAPPTAVLVPFVRPTSMVRVFPQGWCEQAEAFQPAALAADWVRFQALLDRHIPSLTHAVIVLARHVDELLEERQRLELWRAFRVPVFEQILADNGSLLAAECEAHDGLHVESPGLSAEAEASEAAALALDPCGCGKATPRLKRVRPEPERILSVAV